MAVELDASTKTEVRETPPDGLTRRETKTEKTVNSGDGKAGAAATGEKSKTTETEYETRPLTKTTTTTLPSKFKSISVTCAVDLSAPEAKEGEEAAPAPTVKIDDIRQMIVNALGINPATANQVVTVVETKFQATAARLAAAATGPKEEGMFTKDFLLQAGRQLSLGLLVIGALLGLKLVRKGGKKAQAQGSAEIEGQAVTGENLLPAGVPGGRPALKQHIARALQENPDEVRRLFLCWAKNEQGGA